jgi:hypothetical protein
MEPMVARCPAAAANHAAITHSRRMTNLRFDDWSHHAGPHRD